MARMISFFVLVAIIAVVGILSFEVLRAFLLPLFIALLLAVMFRPLHEWFVRRCHGRAHLAAGLTTTGILLIVLLPMLWILARAATETVSLVSELKQDDLVMRLRTLRERLGLDLPPEALRMRFSEIEATVRRARESALNAALEGNREANLRQLWIGDLQDWGRQLKPELERLALPVAAGGEGWSASRKQSLLEYYAKFEARVQALSAAEKDPPKLAQALDDLDAALKKLKEPVFGTPVIAWLKSQTDLGKDQLAALTSRLQELAGPLALGTTQFVGSFLVDLIVGLAVMIVSLYYFLADGPAMIGALMRLSPLDDRYEEQLLAEFSTVTRAVIVSMLLAAFVQGLLAGIGYFFVGLGSVFLLTVLTMLFAMVPFIGATAVWGACALWLFVHDGRPQAAIALAVYGVLVVSMADNVIKPMVLHGRSNLHPLLGLLSVLGGAKALGPIGLVVGPMVVAFLQTLLVMLRSELSSMDAAKASGALTETRAAPRPNTVEMPNTVAVASEGASGVGGAV
jgi:predicted PurR-regulated permease PerM